MLYLVTYDLNKSGQNYDGLIDAIQSYTSVRAMQSVWFVKTSASEEKIFNHLAQYIDQNDDLFVSTVGNWYARLPQKVLDFLKN